jgi:hypothetical protein
VEPPPAARETGSPASGAIDARDRQLRVDRLDGFEVDPAAAHAQVGAEPQCDVADDGMGISDVLRKSRDWPAHRDFKRHLQGPAQAAGRVAWKQPVVTGCTRP